MWKAKKDEMCEVQKTRLRVGGTEEAMYRRDCVDVCKMRALFAPFPLVLLGQAAYSVRSGQVGTRAKGKVRGKVVGDSGLRRIP